MKVEGTDIRVNESGYENIWRKYSGLLGEPVASLKKHDILYTMLNNNPKFSFF